MRISVPGWGGRVKEKACVSRTAGEASNGAELPRRLNEQVIAPFVRKRAIRQDGKTGYLIANPSTALLYVPAKSDRCDHPQA
jgi:hypothetical protein